MHGGGVLSPWAPPSPPRHVVLDPSGAAGGLHRVRLPLALLGIIKRVPSSDQARASHPGSRSDKGRGGVGCAQVTVSVQPGVHAACELRLSSLPSLATAGALARACRGNPNPTRNELKLEYMEWVKAQLRSSGGQQPSKPP